MQRAGTVVRATGSSNFVGACAQSGLAFLRGDFQRAEQWAKSACTQGLLGADTTEGPTGVQDVHDPPRKTVNSEVQRIRGQEQAFTGRWVPRLLALYTELDCEAGMARA